MPDVHLSPNRYHTIRKLLLDCAPVDSNRAIHALFIQSKLSTWKHNVPDATDRQERVELLIERFAGNFNNDGENALLLLLEVLRDNTETGDLCYKQFQDEIGLLRLELEGRIAHQVKGETTMPTPTAAEATLDTLPLDSVPAVGNLPPWSIMPYDPNPHFQGREAELKQLATGLKTGQTMPEK